MSKIDSEKVIKHLQEKWKGARCSMCGEGSWAVQDSAFQMTEFSHGGLAIGGPVIPVVPVMCSNCGNTVLINAILAGVVKQDEEKANE